LAAILTEWLRLFAAWTCQHGIFLHHFPDRERQAPNR